MSKIKIIHLTTGSKRSTTKYLKVKEIYNWEAQEKVLLEVYVGFSYE